MHLLYNLKLIYSGVLLSLMSFIMFGMLSTLFDNYDYTFKHDIKQGLSKLDSLSEELNLEFIKGEVIGSYSLTQLDDKLMRIDYSGYYLRFFSNYIIFSIASSRSDKSVTSRFIVKALKISVVDDMYLLEMKVPALIIDNKIVRESRISCYGSLNSTTK